MSEKLPGNQMQLVAALARREGTTAQLSERFGYTPDELRAFVKEHYSLIESFVNSKDDSPALVTPVELDSLWITQKSERLRRLQTVADLLYQDVMTGSLQGSELATATREYRSYLMLVANELGQLLHRGSGDSASGDTLNVQIDGIDLDTMR